MPMQNAGRIPYGSKYLSAGVQELQEYHYAVGCLERLH